MPRSWAQLLGEDNAQPEPEAERAGLFSRLRDSLSKSRQALTAELASATFDPGDTAAWERLEEALIRADVGVPATAELVQRLEARPDLTDLNAALAEEISRLLGEPPSSTCARTRVSCSSSASTAPARRRRSASWPSGCGSTGTPSSSARPTRFALRPRSSWRSGPTARDAEFVGAERGADPASVAYDAIEAATRRRP